MPNDLNEWNGVGRLTKTPEQKQTTGGMSYVKFGIASNEKFKDKEHVSFFDCTAWGKLSEIICQYAKKGQQVAINGRLRQEKWQTQSGENRYSTSIVVNRFQMIGGKKDAAQPEPHTGVIENDDIPF